MNRFLALVTFLFPLCACSRGATLTFADTTDFAPDYSGRLPVGRVTSVLAYTTTQGCVTQSFQCDGEHDRVESSDPSIVSVTSARYREESAPGGETWVMDSTIAALREGEVTLTAYCSDDVTTLRVRVVP